MFIGEGEITLNGTFHILPASFCAKETVPDGPGTALMFANGINRAVLVWLASSQGFVTGNVGRGPSHLSPSGDKEAYTDRSSNRRASADSLSSKQAVLTSVIPAAVRIIAERAFGVF
jgi:hypothetical protein